MKTISMLKNEYGVWLQLNQGILDISGDSGIKEEYIVKPILVLVAESDFGSTLFGEGSDCIALMAE